MRYITLTILAAFISGCSLFEPRVVYRDRVIERPVLVLKTAEAAKVVKPEYLPIWSISPESSDSDAIRACAETIIIQSGYIKELEEALKPFGGNK